MSMYSYRSDGTVTKFDADGNVESAYNVSSEACTCPAGHRHTCRHRQMLPELLPIADTHWFLDWEDRIVVDFNGTPKSSYDMVIIDEAAPVDPKVWADLPAEQDTPASTFTDAQWNDALMGAPKPGWRRM